MQGVGEAHVHDLRTRRRGWPFGPRRSYTDRRVAATLALWPRAPAPTRPGWQSLRLGLGPNHMCRGSCSVLPRTGPWHPQRRERRGSTLQPGSARAEVLSSPDGALIARRSTRPSGRWAAARHALTRCGDAQRRTRSGSGQPKISAGAPRASRSCATQVWGLNDWQQNGHNDADGHNANDVALVDHQKVPDLFVPPCGGVEDAYVRGAASGANCGSRLFVRQPRLRTIVGAPG